jgi:hypothetical protein
MGITKQAPIFDDVAEWPTRTAQAPAPKDHNKPPLEEVIPAEFREALLADHPDFLLKLDDAVANADKAIADDDDSLAKCGTLMKTYRVLLSHIDATHTDVKAPYLQGGRLVDAEKNTLVARVNTARAKVDAIGNAYVAKRDAEAKAERERLAAEQRRAAEEAARAERERQDAEREALRAQREATTQDERDAAQERANEAARRAEEAMASAALAPTAPAKSEPVRSDEGATVSSKQEWMSKVDDYAKAFKTVKGDAKVREAIDKAVQALVKSTKGQMEIPGVTAWPVAKANFR